MRKIDNKSQVLNGLRWKTKLKSTLAVAIPSVLTFSISNNVMSVPSFSSYRYLRAASKLPVEMDVRTLQIT